MCMSSHVEMQVTMLEVLQIVKDFLNAKSSGLDSLNSERLRYVYPVACLLLSIPQCKINSVIISLIKNKCGDQTDINNYRLIALANIISKVFENIIAERLEAYLWTNHNHFGIMSGYSTDLCIYALTDFIKYFKRRFTSVCVAFLDASKAFGLD